MKSGSLVVPYISTWSTEKSIRRAIVQDGRGIAYAEETPFDRDSGGVLWTRRALKRGHGRPEFGNIHPQRQQRAMRRLLCQVCGGPPDRDERGMLWLLKDHRDDWRGWPNDLLTPHPPVCLPCAQQAIKRCPHLASDHVAVRVAESDVCGVYGLRYRRGSALPIPGEADVIEYGDPGIRWVLASQLVRGLNGCTFVDLEAELVSHA
ncbi:hypothetical protein [Streptomyces chattanoogensis]|uniref:hypothetical protein n=1 Tax=Streptomyces chattanoogensis TaxID=66876 RepID=UPI0036D0341C